MKTAGSHGVTLKSVTTAVVSKNKPKNGASFLNGNRSIIMANEAYF
jgi:hypothetical protein